MGGQLLVRPAAAEVRAMLNKIKMDNMERGRKMTSMNGMNGIISNPRINSMIASTGKTAYTYLPQ